MSFNGMSLSHCKLCITECRVKDKPGKVFLIVTQQHKLILKYTLWKIKPTSYFKDNRPLYSVRFATSVRETKLAFIAAWCTHMQMAPLELGAYYLHPGVSLVSSLVKKIHILQALFNTSKDCGSNTYLWYCAYFAAQVLYGEDKEQNELLTT